MPSFPAPLIETATAIDRDYDVAGRLARILAAREREAGLLATDAGSTTGRDGTEQSPPLDEDSMVSIQNALTTRLGTFHELLSGDDESTLGEAADVTVVGGGGQAGPERTSTPPEALPGQSDSQREVDETKLIKRDLPQFDPPSPDGTDLDLTGVEMPTCPKAVVHVRRARDALFVDGRDSVIEPPASVAGDPGISESDRRQRFGLRLQDALEKSHRAYRCSVRTLILESQS